MIHQVDCDFSLLSITLGLAHMVMQVGVLPSRRESFRQLLRAAGPQVLGLLIQVCDQCNTIPQLMQKMLKCTTSWIRHVPLPSDELARSSIVAFSFQVLYLANSGADLTVLVLVAQSHRIPTTSPPPWGGFSDQFKR